MKAVLDILLNKDVNTKDCLNYKKIEIGEGLIEMERIGRTKKEARVGGNTERKIQSR